VELQFGLYRSLIFTSGLFFIDFRKYLFVFFKLWRDIPDVLGRRLSEAKSAKEGKCTLLLTAKYEPDMVKTDRDNDVTKW